MLEQNLRSTIRTIPDFPKPGIMYKDISPIFLDARLTRWVVEQLAGRAKETGSTAILGIESRGFILGQAIALALDLPFVLVRKHGKLPAETVQQDYALEYGNDIIEMHADVLTGSDRAFIHDDILATGGTARACAQLVNKTGASVSAFGFIGAIAALEGKNKIGDYGAVHSIIDF